MNCKKATWAGLLVFAIQFTLVSMLGSIVGPFLGSSAWAGYAWHAAMTLVLIAIVYSASRWYFTGNSVSALKGVQLGGLFVVISFVVNLLPVLPLVISGQSITQPLLQYITGIPFLITVAATVAAAALAGHMGTKRSACNLKDAVSSCMPEAKDSDEK